MSPQTLAPGTQVAYVPNHAWSEPTDPAEQPAPDLEHPDVEFGFVTSQKDPRLTFCRFWQKRRPGVLRTTLSSESCLTENLVPYESVVQLTVDTMLATLGLIQPAGGTDAADNS